MEYAGHRRYGMEYVVLRRQQEPMDINKPRVFQPLYLDDATPMSYHKPLLQNGQTIRWSIFDWASNWTICWSTFGRASQKTTLVLIETYQNKNYENVVDWICFRKFFQLCGIAVLSEIVLVDVVSYQSVGNLVFVKYWILSSKLQVLCIVLYE